MASSALTETLSESQHSKQEQLLSDLPARHLGALWEVMRALVPKVPNPKASPAVWHYKEVRPSLIEAGKTVSAEQAERRVLMLVNPSMSTKLFLTPRPAPADAQVSSQKHRTPRTHYILACSSSTQARQHPLTSTWLLRCATSSKARVDSRRLTGRKCT